MSEEILSAALVAQLTAERDAWRGKAERAEAEAAGLLAELSSYRAALLAAQERAERSAAARRLANILDGLKLWMVGWRDDLAPMARQQMEAMIEEYSERVR